MFLLVACLSGLLIGSYLNVVIHRGPRAWGLTDGVVVAGPRSACPACGETIAVRDLVPIANYVLLRGRCRYCRAKIPWRYPAVEAAAAALFVAAGLTLGPSVEWALAAAFIAILLALAAIDLETGYLPDALTFPLLIGGLAANAVDLFAPLPQSVLGAAVGYGGFEAIRIAYARIRGREGLGGGDAKLLGAIGGWLGASALPGVVFLASLMTLGVALAAGRSKSPERSLPFGPGLAAAAVIMLLAGDGFRRTSGL